MADLHFNLVLGTPFGMPADLEDIVYLASSLPAGSTFTGTGIGRHEFNVACAAIMLGGHVRVGFEDNVYLKKGVLARSNGELVEKVVRLAHELGREIASPDEARQILGLNPYVSWPFINTLADIEMIPGEYMKKLTSKEDLKKHFWDGMSLMVGGFLGCGSPEKMIDLIIEMNVKNLTIIVNDTAFPDKGVGRLIVNGQVSRVITSHIGTNPETRRLYNEGKIEVEFVPQGTLAERIRAGGSGLGGVMTPTGVGTMVEDGKQKLNINGKEYLLELPMRADVAIIERMS